MVKFFQYKKETEKAIKEAAEWPQVGHDLEVNALPALMVFMVASISAPISAIVCSMTSLTELRRAGAAVAMAPWDRRVYVTHVPFGLDRDDIMRSKRWKSYAIFLLHSSKSLMKSSQITSHTFSSNSIEVLNHLMESVASFFTASITMVVAVAFSSVIMARSSVVFSCT